MKKVVSLLAGFAAMSALSAPAFASSVSVIGQPADSACASKAALAAKSGQASVQSLLDCNSALRSADEMTPAQRAGIFVNRGVVQLAMGRGDAAVADFRAAVRLDGTLVEAHSNLGVALIALHHPTEAVAEFTAALALNPAEPAVVHYNRAQAEEDAGDIKAAFVDYRRAAELAPAWDAPRKELSRFQTVRRPALG